MKRKFLSILLTLALLCGLTSTALAAAVVLSPQKLTVDGEPVSCEKYNIDGSNYFKLRDIALLLNGSDCQFAVGWDADTQTVTITSGEIYEPNGSELVIGEDKSATAVPSKQTILINGQADEGLSVYNLGGNNFFKLRDLGEALGFTVDYDAATNTAIVLSVPPKTVATQLDYQLAEGDALTVSDLIFNGDVNVYGDNASITFVRCEFNGNVINNSKEGTAVWLYGNTFAPDSRCVLNAGVKEGSLEYTMPKIMLGDAVPVDCEQLGTVTAPADIGVTLNGKTYTLADADYYLGANGFESYTGQEADTLYVGQWWEKGQQIIFIMALSSDES